MAKETLRERKQQRTRESIIDAAHALFAERGFDHVTVTDIAERAEVGRSTFFRYFGDKQEVVFGDDGDVDALVAAAAAAPADPPGTLAEALVQVRALVVPFVESVTAHPERYTAHERLVEQHPELRARSLTKQRRYADAITQILTRRGADRATATLAAELGMACYFAARTVVDDDPRRLPGAVAVAFDRLADLDP
ncbi:TetR/AcrR family transcriptional regulator [Jiangella gansuensis]|uniref:TetR/AcrR family transcriptional regulator n=1 Tax=Jiangella gansuensis TaxID=281473 RepID=UPI0004B0CDAD|nr:TetR family transcriptional regulator [Jiangella gansuensis]